MSDIRYSVRINRIKKSITEGLEVIENGRQVTLKSTHGICSSVFLLPFDGGEDKTTWGRLKMRCTHGKDTAFYVFVAAADEYIMPEKYNIAAEKELILSRFHGRFVSDADDLVLYDLRGRFLYVLIEVVSQSQTEFTCSDIVVDKIGDNFMQTFPSIYQERNSFFHRYMSIFSSIYNDFEDKINDLPKLLDLDTCPARLLPVYSKWLGIDLGENFFDEDTTRRLVKEVYVLNQMKGTRWCLERITEILMGEKAIIVERNQLEDYLSPDQMIIYNSIYGDSRYDVNILVKDNLTPVKHSQLEFLLEQFVPVKTRLHIIDLNNVGGLDLHVYLDVNAQIVMTDEGSLDMENAMDSNIILR